MVMMLHSRYSKVFAVSLIAASSVGAGLGGAYADTSFQQTDAKVWGPFEQYWKAHGGLAQFGMPRTSVFPAKGGYDAQWFERAMFTYNPKNPDPYKVELQLLGRAFTDSRSGEAPFKEASPDHDTQKSYFSQTEHNLSGKFLEYWKAHGGVAIYGYPISEAFTERSKSDGKEYMVQYFERNRLELHPERAGTPYEVQLGLLGSEMLDAQGGPSAFANLGAPRRYPASASGGIIVPPGEVVPIGTPDPTGAPPPVPNAPALPPTSGAAIFTADFASPDLGSWQQLAPFGVNGRPATWRAVDGRLAQTGVFSADRSDDEAVLVSKDQGFSDFALDTYYYATSGTPLGLVFRYSDVGFYLLKLSPGLAGSNGPTVELFGVIGGKPYPIASSTLFGGYKFSTWQLLSVSADGAKLTARVDGQTVLEATDSGFSAGGVGFYTVADGTARFDNLRVTASTRP